MSSSQGYHLGLTGWPLGHSLSPVLHQAALDALGLAGEYSLYPAPPLPEGRERLVELLDQMRTGRLDGLNVTIPHKQTVVPLLDRLTSVAQTARAVNTIYREDGKLVGDNTDVPGFLADLHSFLSGVRLSNQKALLLGAGGAASAVGVALAQEGWQVTIAARRLEQAEALSLRMALLGIEPPGAILLDGNTLRQHLGVSSNCLIVNATPLGMSPRDSETPWPERLAFPPGAAIYDLVYNPRETRLVRTAHKAGLPARNGLGMLAEQAALAFERWTGRSAPREAMWEALSTNEHGLAGII